MEKQNTPAVVAVVTGCGGGSGGGGGGSDGGGVGVQKAVKSGDLVAVAIVAVRCIGMVGGEGRLRRAEKVCTAEVEISLSFLRLING